MEPISAVSVASAVVQLIDFSSRVISKGAEISKSAQGCAVGTAELEVVAESMKDLSQILTSKLAAFSRQGPLSENERVVENLGRSCETVAKELQDHLFHLTRPVRQDVLHRGKARKWNSIRQALSTVWLKGDIEALEHRLQRLREQLILGLVLLLK